MVNSHVDGISSKCHECALNPLEGSLQVISVASTARAAKDIQCRVLLYMASMKPVLMKHTNA